ncbi:hypothetical protein ALC56_08486, partial [Trachymyrmex septentrionalis]
TVSTTSLLDTCPTSIRPISTANLRLSFIAIATTSSGRLMSLNGGLLRSAIATDIIASHEVTGPINGSVSPSHDNTTQIDLPC